MKKYLYLLSFLGLWPGLLLAQAFRQADAGGAFSPPRNVCISPRQYLEINQRLAQNVAQREMKEQLRRRQANARTAAVSLEWPLRLATGSYPSYYGISNYIDHNPAYDQALPAADRLQDYSGGTRSYDVASGYNHAGTDIFLWPFSWNLVNTNAVEVVATAAGTLIAKTDGNFDQNCSFNSLTPNAVYIEHPDGTVAWYLHLKNGSVTTKNVGDAIALGEYLGVVASSGNSTGPHLHLELRSSSGVGNTVIDPWVRLPTDPGTGNPNPTNNASLWANQKPYYESTLNRVLTHDAAPVLNACPTEDDINDASAFAPGQTVYFAAYYHDQLAGQVSTYTVYNPDNTVAASWTHNSAAAHYPASYWYWSTTLPGNAPLGTWRFEVQYQGQTVSQNFSVGGATPVELLYFRASETDRQARLDWATTNERNNRGFGIEKSLDALHFEQIGYTAGANTSGQHRYAFTDDALSTLSYYRLRQEDTDGRITYTRAVAVAPQNLDFQVFPNPSSGTLRVYLPEAGRTVRVYDARGRAVFEQTLTTPTAVLQLGPLPAGIYSVVAESSSTRRSQRVVVQR